MTFNVAAFDEALRVRGLCRYDVAKQAGIRSGTISNICSGRVEPSAATMRKIAIVLAANPVLPELADLWSEQPESEQAS